MFSTAGREGFVGSKFLEDGRKKFAGVTPSVRHMHEGAGGEGLWVNIERRTY